MTPHETYEDDIALALRRLERAKAALTKAIATYPTPVSGCDAQFNRLLSDRTRVASALQALYRRPFIPTPRVLEVGAEPETP